MCIRIHLYPHWLLPAPLSVCRCMQASVCVSRLCAYMLCVCNVRGPNCSISADYSLVCRLLWYQSSCSQMMMGDEICRTGIGYNGGAYHLRSRMLVRCRTSQPHITCLSHTHHTHGKITRLLVRIMRTENGAHFYALQSQRHLL